MSSVFHHKIPFPAFSANHAAENLTENQPENTANDSRDIAILILAAGNSARLGTPKQLVDFNGKPLICHLIEQALFVKTKAVFVVLGGNQELISPKISHLPVHTVRNEYWQNGMGQSIQTGVRAILKKHPKIAGILMLVADQPFVSADLIYQLIQTQQATGAKIVASTYAGNQGVPAIFDHTLFGQLLALDGQTGAKKIIQQDAENTPTVSFPEGIFDIDTPADLQRIEEWHQIIAAKNKAPKENWED